MIILTTHFPHSDIAKNIEALQNGSRVNLSF